jgi:hypothetical protein
MKPFSSLVPANGMMYMGFPGLPSGGQSWFVDPYYGSDGNSGRRPDRPVKTLAQALSLATADQNDIVYMMARSNTAAYTTDYQSATLDWNKDGVHLIGINAGQRFSHRSRVALLSSYNTASNLVTVSADCCLIANMEFFAGVAGTSPTGCMKVTGTRNHFFNCQIAGIGNAANDIAGAYSLWHYGNASENYYEKCVIGCDTVARGSYANAEILFTPTAAAVGSARTIFDQCVIVGLCESAGNYLFVSANAANAIDRFLLFKDCVMHNPGAASAGVAMTQAMQIHANAGGNVILHNTTIVGANNVNASDTGLILVGAGGVIPGIVGTATDVTDLGLALVTTNA